MNPFVNLKKRSVSLPPGCKDLIDVLRVSKEDEGAIWRFVRLILFLAHQKGATDLVIGPAEGDEAPLKFKVDGNWIEESEFPARIRPGVVAELTRLARLPEGAFPKEGILSVPLAGVEIKWKVEIKEEAGACVLSRIEN